LAGGREARRR